MKHMCAGLLAALGAMMLAACFDGPRTAAGGDDEVEYNPQVAWEKVKTDLVERLNPVV